MKKFLLGLLTGLVLAGVALVVLVFAAAKLGDRKPAIPPNAVLVMRLNGNTPEQPGPEMPFFFPGSEARPTMFETWDALRKAAADKRIRALLIEPRRPEIGWAKAREIRDAILQFRKSGKPVFASLHTPATRDYYIATAAEKIYMAPEDVLDVKGLRAELMFFKGSLDKLGVRAEIEHAGKYKDAGDILTRTTMSPETREVMNGLLDHVYTEAIDGIASGRNKPAADVRRLIDNAPVLPKAAVSAGLIDGLLYEDEVDREIKQKLGGRDVPKISYRDYMRVPAASVGLDGNSRIAVLAADGAILRGDGRYSPFGSDEGIYSARLVKQLQEIGKDKGIRGVIVRIDSPGGDALASDDILHEMKALSKNKPLVISMSDVAASGGYYMAMTGDPVVAYPSTVTGSIGVIYGKLNLQGLYEKLGVTKDILIRGENAAIDSDYAPLTEAGRAKLRETIDHIYRGFLSRVAEGRKRKYEAIEPVAQGRAWVGAQARQNGLVDELGGFDKAVELLRKKANLTGGLRFELYPRRKSVFEAWLPKPDTSAAQTSIGRLLRQPEVRALLEGGYLRMAPYRLEIK